MAPPAYFVDSGFWFARWNRRDLWHHIANRILRELAELHVTLFTTDVVILEFMTLSRTRGERLPEIERRLTAIEKSSEIIYTSIEDLVEARLAFARYDTIPFSGFDASSMSVMQRLKIDRVLTTDDEFVKCGRFVEVRPNLPERRIVMLA